MPDEQIEEEEEPLNDNMIVMSFRGMADHWYHRSAQAHQEFAEMKYSKKKLAGGETIKSKKDFDKFRKKVWQYSKLFRRYGNMCNFVADCIEAGNKNIEFSKMKEESLLKKAGKMIYHNFINPRAAANLAKKNGVGKN